MIFEAIAAIKIANEAIGAIKEFAGHVESVGQMGKDLTKLADAQDELEKAAKDGDMEAFWALEDIKRHNEEIKRQFVWAGRAGLYEDYCKFIANRKQLRENEKKRAEAKRLAKRKAIKNGLIITGAVLGIFTAVGIAAYMVYWMVSLRGR
jgi:hypothetical protein